MSESLWVAVKKERPIPFDEALRSQLAAVPIFRGFGIIPRPDRRPLLAAASMLAASPAVAHVDRAGPDSAFAWLNRSQWGTQTYYLLRENRNLNSLRGDPRFPALLRRLHMP